MFVTTCSSSRMGQWAVPPGVVPHNRVAEPIGLLERLFRSPLLTTLLLPPYVVRFLYLRRLIEAIKTVLSHHELRMRDVRSTLPCRRQGSRYSFLMHSDVPANTLAQ